MAAAAVGKEMLATQPSGSHAQQVWCFSRQRFNAVHRALWHLANLRQSLTASCPRSVPGCKDEAVQVVNVVPDQQAAAAASTPECRLSTETQAAAAASTPECRLSTETQVCFLSARYHFIFSLDLSPSMCVVDTSFKGFSTGTYLLDSLQPCLVQTLELLLHRMHVGGASLQPEIFISVLAHGSPAFKIHLPQGGEHRHPVFLLQRTCVTRENLQGVLQVVSRKLTEFIDEQARWLMQFAVESSTQSKVLFAKQLTTSLASQSMDPVSEANDVSSVLNSLLMVLSTSPVPDATPALVLFTDGVMASSIPSVQFDGILMQLNTMDVALHIMQIGGGFAPWSTLGMCSDLDLLHFLASSTPGGVLFQDHHVSSILSECNANTPVNRLQRAWLFRPSALSISASGQEKMFTDGSFLSSLTDAQQEQHLEDKQNYISHLDLLGSKVPEKIQLVTMECDEGNPPPVATPRRAISSSSSSQVGHSPTGHRRRHSTTSVLTRAPRRHFSQILSRHGTPVSDPNIPVVLERSLTFENGEELHAAQLYAAPGSEADSYVHQNEDYTLQGVSLAQLVECRVREGFQLVKHTAGGHWPEVTFRLTWRPMFEVLYLAVLRQQEVHVWVRYRTPSWEYLKHKGNRGQATGDAGEHQGQLDRFLRALRHVDKTLGQLALCVPAVRWSDLEIMAANEFQPQLLHHWFSVHHAEYYVGDQGIHDLVRHLGGWATTCLVQGRCYWRTLDDRSMFRMNLHCRCCAPDGVALHCWPNTSLLLGGRPSMPFSHTLPPCCLVLLSEVSHQTISLIVGSIGLCPHSEEALLEHVQRKVLGISSNRTLGFPGLVPRGAPSACLLGLPGMLRAVVEGPPGNSSYGGSSKKTKAAARSSVADMVPAAGRKHLTVDCGAADTLRSMRSPFFNLTMDWHHLKLYFPGYTWKESFKTTESARCLLRLLQRMRSDEGWCCITRSEDACCFVKRIPLHATETAPSWDSGRGGGGASSASSSPDEESVDVDELAIAGGGASQLGGEGFCIFVSDGAESFRRKLDEKDAEAESVATTGPSGEPGYLEADSAASGAEEKDEAAVQQSPPSSPDAAEAPPFGFGTAEEEIFRPSSAPMATAAGLHGAEAPAAAQPAQEAAPPRGGAFCALFYSARLEGGGSSAPAKLGSRRQAGRREGPPKSVTVCLWHNSPLGSFHPALLQQETTPRRRLGPLCAGVTLGEGRAEQLPWKKCHGVRSVSVFAAPVYPQWPASLHLKFLGEDGAVTFQLRSCAGAAEAVLQSEGHRRDIVSATARATGGPMVLHGIWVEVSEATVALDREAGGSAIPFEALGPCLRDGLADRDGRAGGAVGLVEQISSHEVLKSELHLPRPSPTMRPDLRSNTEPVDLLRTSASSVTEDAAKGRAPEIAQAQGLAGLLESVHRWGDRTMRHAVVAEWQQVRFLERVHQLMQWRMDVGSDDVLHRMVGRSPVEAGHYFLSLHRAARQGTGAAASAQFTIICVPDASFEPAGPLTPLHIYVGDGNVETLHPPAVDDPVVAAVLSSGGTEGGQHQVDTTSGISHLSKRSKDLVAQVENAHWATCAEAIYHRLCAGSASLTEEEISEALNACQRMTATLKLSDLAILHTKLGGARSAAVWDFLDATTAKILKKAGFEVAECASTRSSRPGLSALFFYCDEDSQVREVTAQVDIPLCFLMLQVADGGLSGPPSRKASQDLGAQLPFEPKESPDDLELRGPSPTALRAQQQPVPEAARSLFRPAFEQGAADELRVTAFYLKRQDSSGVWASRLHGAVPKKPYHGRRKVSWEGDVGLFAQEPARGERITRLGEDLAAAVDLAHADLLRLSQPTSPVTAQTVQLVISRLLDGMDERSPQAQLAHSRTVLLPLARQQMRAEAHRVLLAELAVRPAAAPTAPALSPPKPSPAPKPVDVDDAHPPGTASGIFASALTSTADPPGASALLPSVQLQQVADVAGARAALFVCQPTVQHASSAESSPPALPPADRVLPSPAAPPPAPPCAPPIPAPPFWFLVVLSEDELQDRYGPSLDVPSSFQVQLQLLFTPTFFTSQVAQVGQPPSPDAYFESCEAILHAAAVRMNQKLLLQLMLRDHHLSEVLHADLQVQKAGAEEKDYIATPRLTPKYFLQKMAEEGGAPKRKLDGSASAGGAEADVNSPSAGATATQPPVQWPTTSGRVQSRRRSTTSQDTFETDEQRPSAAVLEDVRFIKFLHDPQVPNYNTEAFSCAMQGSVQVTLAPCLYNFCIIGWLAGGEAEEVNATSASTKVSFQRQKNAQLNEVYSLFARNGVQTHNKTIWLFCLAGEKGDMPHFVRPSYQRSADGSVMLMLRFFGLAPLPEDKRRLLERNLEAQLEKLAIVKLQLHTLDRQQTSALPSAVLEFLRPAGSKPGKSVLHSIPPLEGSLLEYAHFVRRALLGLLEPCSEELQREKGPGKPADLQIPTLAAAAQPALPSPSKSEEQLASLAEAPQGGEERCSAAACRRGTMTFLYKRRTPEQVITDVKRYDQRGTQNRDKACEKVLQFQGRIGEGVAFVQVFFISAATGRPLEDLTECQPREPRGAREAWEATMESTNDLHMRIESDHVVRKAGRFDHLDLSMPSLRFCGSGHLSGYLLLDVWHRAMDDEHASELAQEIGVALDQALKEYRLQATLREAKRCVSGTFGDDELLVRLEEFQRRCEKLTGDMVNQHLSSLLTHNPVDIEVGPEEPHCLPLWALVTCVEGLYAMLKSAASSNERKELNERFEDCVGLVTLCCKPCKQLVLRKTSCTMVGKLAEEAYPGAPEVDGGVFDEPCYWYDMEDQMRSMLVTQMCKGVPRAGSSRGPLAQSLLDDLLESKKGGPLFTVTWGPTMGSWHRRLRALKRGASSAAMPQQQQQQQEQQQQQQQQEHQPPSVMRQDDASSAASQDPGLQQGFVHEVGQGGLGLPRRLDQHRVSAGGAAALKKHTLAEWREVETFLKAEQLAAPFLSVTVGTNGATIRAVHVDPILMLKVQYFLQSQFLWAWSRAQLLGHMCACELGMLGENQLDLADHLRNAFSWVFSKHSTSINYLPAAQSGRPHGREDDDATLDLDESVISVATNETPQEVSPYYIFSCPRTVAHMLVRFEMVPSPAELSSAQAEHATESQQETEFSRGTSVISAGSAVVDRGDHRHPVPLHASASHAIGSASNSSANFDPARKLPYATSHARKLSGSRPGGGSGLPRSTTPEVRASECPASLAIVTGDEEESPRLDVREALAGQGIFDSLRMLRRCGQRSMGPQGPVAWQDTCGFGVLEEEPQLRAMPIRALRGHRRHLKYQRRGDAACGRAFRLRWLQRRNRHRLHRLAPGGRGRSGETKLADPLTLYGERWLFEVARRMWLQRLKHHIHGVLSDWEKLKMPLAGWAHEAVASYSAEADLDAELLNTAEAMYDKMPRQARTTWRDDDIFEAEALLLLLVYKLTKPVASFSAHLFIGSGLDMLVTEPSRKSRSRVGKGGTSPASPTVDATGPELSGQVPEWKFTTRSGLSLEHKLREASPLLMIRQRFLSSILSAFQRPQASKPSGSSAEEHQVASWDLVLCCENPLPWHDWDTLGSSRWSQEVLMRPQTLLLHRSLGQDGQGLLAEISCRADDNVHFEILAKDPSCPVSMKAVEDVRAAIQDFCFDFQLRCLVGSFRPASRSYMWPAVDVLLRGAVWVEPSHRERARNILVHGVVQQQKLTAWLNKVERQQKGATPIAMKAQNLVSFIHTTAHHLGFEVTGEAHEPLLALIAEDHNFLRVLRAHQQRSDIYFGGSSGGDEAQGAAPAVAQGVRCVLFACPTKSDLARPPADCVTGELGFQYVAVLVDFAWCTPPSARAAGGDQNHGAEWARLEDLLSAAAQEVLLELGRLATARLACVRRLEALRACPTRSRLHDFQEVLEGCCSHVDLLAEPTSGSVLCGLRGLPVMSWEMLGQHLRATFSGRCCDFTGALDESLWRGGLGREASSGFRQESSGGLQEALGTIQEAAAAAPPPRHLFVLTNLGRSSSLVEAQDRHQVVLHFVWDGKSQFERMWLHSSHRLATQHWGGSPAHAAQEAEPLGPASDGRGLQQYVDDWPSAEPVRYSAPRRAAGGSGPESSTESGGGGAAAALDLLLRRTLATLLEYAMRAHRAG